MIVLGMWRFGRVSQSHRFSFFGFLIVSSLSGQEEGTTKMQEGVRITPFNVQEEMEEGHFDAEGNYILEKKEDLRDAWLEELDEYTDEDYEKLMKKKADERLSAEDESATKSFVTDLEIYKKIIPILKAGESVMRALKRLGAGIKQQPKFRKGTVKAGSTSRETDEVKIEFENLTSAADLLLQRGNLEIYQETLEKVRLTVRNEESKRSLDVNEEEDIFGETFVAKEVTVKEMAIESSNSGAIESEYSYFLFSKFLFSNCSVTEIFSISSFCF